MVTDWSHPALGDAVTRAPGLQQGKLIGCQTHHLYKAIIKPLLALSRVPWPVLAVWTNAGEVMF